MDNVLKDDDYRNMFINCASTTFYEPEPEPEPEPEQTNVQQVATDGFDWDLDMKNAYS